MFPSRSTPALIYLTGVALILLGVALAAPGVWLIALGDSSYYAVAGALMVASGILIALGRRAGLWVYAAMLAYTLIWALSRVGLDGWRLLPPLALPSGIGLWVFGPWVGGRMNDPSGRIRVNRAVLGGMGGCAALFACMFACGWAITASRTIQHNPFPADRVGGALTNAESLANNEWRYMGGTSAGDRFGVATQITAKNAHNLKPAWIFHTGDLPRPGENARGREFSFEATPLKVGDNLVFCTPHRDVVALDATTGKQVWRYSPHGNYGQNIYQACRGVSYFEAPAGLLCPHRIISTDSGSPPTLFALDADTGRLCPAFGTDGIVDLRQGMGTIPAGFHFITSPPMVMNNRIMLSGWVYDNQTVDEPSGVIRGFDATTGQLAWGWDMGHTPANRPLNPGEIFTRGTPNGWGVYTADPGLNMVYVPLGIATPDYYGVKRRAFDERYDTSLVALDITTGEERWHFQSVHHDLWDFDLPVGPSLVDLPDGSGRMTPALVQTTKQGELFVLNRRTGKPFYRVEERPVPGGTIANERYSLTQPYSPDMPNLRRPDPSTDDLWGITPFDQMACRIAFKRMNFQGLFTPPSLQGTIGFPAFDGVDDWYGATIDPTRGVLYVNTTYIPFTMQLVPREKALKEGLFKPWDGWNQPYPEPPFANNPQHGLPYAAVIKPWLGFLGAPCLAPPWGRTQAIDLVHHRVIWERALGTTRNVGPTNTLRMPVGLPTGIFSMGGTLTTPTGLVFMGATADQAFRVLDGRNGHILYETALDAGGNATPMTYMGQDGRQYVVLAVGGHGGLKTRNGDEIVAFALPQQGK
ncbi:membrane-bound PQQ-dependent dehydrogenase, glucose/quinate/shikimate family [Gluconacetobacter azotocaptans]|uniref:membrane-bound PQQ-dependent dehydrogenase, glucose/quinate/shikimate family n=1 Tax=Gluconacetobacter azotocaptans TaxID=142834 RepID=UPI001FD34CDD|nr:membrane-bound PQQ-dependent dehydrogenase, glucose/quinate/shikimate family [Gluconacetobacter azotocaptans]GBQ27539.1 PQQ-dependent dehydrogenase 3 [Gluconacetobacter azotocaptans DSM 13594]